LVGHCSRREAITRAFRRFGFSPRLLSPQAALHVALALRHELIRAERTNPWLPQRAGTRQRGLLRLSVDACRDIAKPLAQGRLPN
jgi:hypothetical protein